MKPRVNDVLPTIRTLKVCNERAKDKTECDVPEGEGYDSAYSHKQRFAVMVICVLAGMWGLDLLLLHTSCLPSLQPDNAWYCMML